MEELENTKKKLETSESCISEMKSKFSALEEKIKQKDIELDVLNKEIKSLEEQRQKLKQKIPKSPKSGEPGELESLNKELKSMEHQKLEFEKLYEKEKLFTTKLQNEIRDKETELSTSISELEQLKACGGGDADNAESELLQEIRLLKFEKDDIADDRNRLEIENRSLIKDLVRRFEILLLFCNNNYFF